MKIMTMRTKAMEEIEKGKNFGVLNYSYRTNFNKIHLFLFHLQKTIMESNHLDSQHNHHRHRRWCKKDEPRFYNAMH